MPAYKNHSVHFFPKLPSVKLGRFGSTYITETLKSAIYSFSFLESYLLNTYISISQHTSKSNSMTQEERNNLTDLYLLKTLNE